MMSVPLLDSAMAAHGGIEAWQRLRCLEIDLIIGGNMLALRWKSPRPRPLKLLVDTGRVRATLSPFPKEGMRGVFEGNAVTIETESGVVTARRALSRSKHVEAGRRWIWDDLDLLYFLGYALWNYSLTPYLFTWPGFQCAETEPWREPDGSLWRRLQVTWPADIPTHSHHQTFYFDEHGLLRRLDYTAEVFGSFARAAHYCYDHKVFDGLVVPTHRVVFARRRSGLPITLFAAMEGRIHNVVAQRL